MEVSLPVRLETVAVIQFPSVCTHITKRVSKGSELFCVLVFNYTHLLYCD